MLHELPAANAGQFHSAGTEVFDGLEHGAYSESEQQYEQAALLWDQAPAHNRPSLPHLESQRGNQQADLSEEDLTISFVGLNALEIAAIANAKKFLSQRVVQNILNDIWSGHIVFWESLSVHSRKKAQMYSQR